MKSITDSERVSKWRKATKVRIVNLMGNKCQICSYDKCIRALELHHLDPKAKELSFGKIIANPISWDRIFNELLKCILLCSNCHREIHAGISKIPNKYTVIPESARSYKEIILSLCPICDKPKGKTNKTCSKFCASKLRRKIDWDRINLYDLIINQKLSLTKIAKSLNVSDNAIRKRARKLNIV